MKFSKQRMIERLTKEGRANMIDEQVLSIMDNLDGQEASTSSWSRRVYGDPVLSVKGRDGEVYEVNEKDCL